MKKGKECSKTSGRKLIKMKKIALKIIYTRLANIAKEMLEYHQPTIIAVTGSVGKTSTKEAIAHLLKSVHHDEVRATSGNLNAEIGVPLTIMGYTKQPSKAQWPIFLMKIKKHLKDKKYPKYLILEMGVENQGDIDYFCAIAKPTIGVITAATPAHVANFSSLKDMQKEKCKLSVHVAQDKLFYNCDDEFLSENIKYGHPFGIDNQNAYIYAECIDVSANGNQYDLVIGEDRLKISNRLLGKQMIYSDLAAAGVARQLGMKLAEIKEGLKTRKPYLGRMNLLRGKNNINIIDDTYNANPASVKAAIDTLSEISCNGRRVLILGNMNELGDIEREEHINIARYIPKNINVIVFVGPNAKDMKDTLGRSSDVFSYSNRIEAQRNLSTILIENDLVLIKASQNNNYFEEMVKILLPSNKNLDQILVRQGREWRGKKNKVYS